MSEGPTVLSRFVATATDAGDWLSLTPGGAFGAARPKTGFSLRRDNRARLETRMLREVWGQRTADPTPETALIAPSVARVGGERKLILGEEG